MDVRLGSGIFRVCNLFSSPSLFIVLFINALFFAGYIILKDPLAYLLFHQGFSLNQAYSITTTANLLLSFLALFFGIFMQSCMDQKQALLVSIFLCNMALLLLHLGHVQFTLLAVNCYVVGGGLYFFNILIFINRLCHDAQSRIYANYHYRIFTNAGAILGLCILIQAIQGHHAFKWSLILCLLALSLMMVFYHSIELTHQKRSLKQCVQFYGYLSLLFALTYVALGFQSQTRIAVVILFVLGLIYAFIYAIRSRQPELRALMGLILILNLPYWLASTLFLNGFFYFLNHDVSPLFGGMASTYLTLIDPLMNVLVGLSMLAFPRKNALSVYQNLKIASLALVFAFLILVLGLAWIKPQAHLHFIYPLLSLMGFALAEFLMQTHLNARIRTQLGNDARSEFLATGIMRATRAFASVLVFYLMSTVAMQHQSLYQEMQAYDHIFWALLVICICSALGLILFKSYFFSDGRDA